MTWLVFGGSLICLAPVAGAVIVGGLLAFHELRSRAGVVARAGSRASTELLDEFLADELGAETQRRTRRWRVPARRREPVLLYELLDERRPRQQAIRRPRPVPVTRAARPTRLVPLTA